MARLEIFPVAILPSLQAPYVLAETFLDLNRGGSVSHFAALYESGDPQTPAEMDGQLWDQPTQQLESANYIRDVIAALMTLGQEFRNDDADAQNMSIKHGSISHPGNDEERSLGARRVFEEGGVEAWGSCSPASSATVSFGSYSPHAAPHANATELAVPVVASAGDQAPQQCCSMRPIGVATPDEGVGSLLHSRPHT